jgi:hypothetical protein
VTALPDLGAADHFSISKDAFLGERSVQALLLSRLPTQDSSGTRRRLNVRCPGGVRLLVGLDVRPRVQRHSSEKARCQDGHAHQDSGRGEGRQLHPLGKRFGGRVHQARNGVLPRGGLPMTLVDRSLA